MERATWIFRPLDEATMQRAADHLVGTHDFSAFRAAECQAASPVRELHELSVRRFDAGFVSGAAPTVPASHGAQHRGSTRLLGTRRTRPGGSSNCYAARDRTRAAPTLGRKVFTLPGRVR